MTPPRRPAFTLLETLLAASLGAVIVAVGVAIFGAVQRADRSLEARALEQSELNKLHLVMQRSFSTLLVSNLPAPPRETARAEPVPAPGAIANRRVRQGVYVPLRFRLELDPRLSGAIMVKSDTTAMITGADALSPQRLEVTLTDAPISSGFWQAELAVQQRRRRALAEGTTRAERSVRAGDRSLDETDRRPGESELDKRERERSESRSKAAEDRASADKNRDSSRSSTPAPAPGPAPEDGAAAEDEISAPLKAIRGVFELRPEQNPDGSIATAQGAPLYALWWTPLSARETGIVDAPEQEPSPLGDPLLVASRLRYARWLMYDNGERKGVLAGARQTDLPAYVELEAETANGLYANWMFEVAWAMGPEVAARPREETDRAGDSKGAARLIEPSRPAAGGDK